MPRTPATAAARALAIVVVALAAVIGATATALAQQGAPLVGQWPMESTGDLVPDVSGNGHDGSPSGNGDIPGRFGNAMSFPDPASSRVTVPDSPALEPQRLTLMAWVRRLQNAAPPGAHQTIAAKGSNAACDRASYALYTGGSGGLSFYVAGTAPAPGVVLSPDAGAGLWQDQAWHAVAGTYDGARVRLYVDGAQVGDGTPVSTEIPYGLGAGALDALTIGAYANPACSSAFTLNGGVDEVRLYDRALSATEIARLQTAPGADPPVLVPDDTGGGGGGPPPGGGGPPPGVPPPAPIVPPPAPGPTTIATNISAPAALAARAPAVLVAETTGTPASRYLWDLDADGKTDLSCAGNQPAVAFRPGGGTSVAVRMTAVDGVGATSTLSKALTMTPEGGAASGSAAAKLAGALAKTPVRACGTSKSFLAPVTSIADQICQVPTTMHAGILAVQGCLHRLTSLDQIPAAERAIVDQLRGYVRVEIGQGQFISIPSAINLSDAYITKGPVRVNGVDVTPRAGASIVVYPQIHRIVSSNAGVSVGDIELATPPGFQLDTRVVGGGIPLGSFARLPGFLKAIGSFPLGGNVDVRLDGGGATVTVRLALPSFLDVFGGSGLGEVRMRATLEDGLVLDYLRIGPLDAAIGPLGITDFQITYSRAQDEWRGQGRACVIPGLPCLSMVPDDGGVVIRHGRLYEAGASLPLDPGITVFPGVTLNKFGFKIGLDPTRVGGNVTLRALSILKIDGRLIIAMPSPAEPYIPTVADVGRSFPADIYNIPFTTPTFAVGGDASISLPIVGDTRIGGAYFLYSYPGKLAFGGGINFSVLDAISVDGGVDGRINFENGRFNLAGHIRACIADVICAGAVANVSSRGVGGCVELGPLNVGGGVQWDGPTIKIWPFDGCKWSRFAELDVFGTASAAQAGGPVTVKVAKGDPSTAIELDGAGGAPRVRVTGPGGTDATSTDGPGLTRTPQARIMRSETLKQTVVGLVDPVPGTYTITPLDGSPPIAKTLAARDQPDAHATAVVRGTGSVRSLTYDVARRPQQRVTFVEHGPEGERDIGTISGGGKGTLKFTTAPGTRPRRVDAQFELDGLPAERLTVARFTPPSAKLARPRKLHARRRGSALRTTWAAVPGATRYELVVTLTDGTQRRMRTRARSTTIRAVARSVGGTVRVRAVADLRQGRPASVRFRAQAKARTRFTVLTRPKSARR